ncbi:hypothetical protein [Chromatium okenii]|uniref:hypothetical protein n=1 Tax=Chromatium okenii TaxID=61644 RepID=UPI001F5BD307|nr:hypothetical protein [Chromatium okenii]
MRVIDDTYNANPDSIAAAVQCWRSWTGGAGWCGDLRNWAKCSALHEEIGHVTRAAGIEHLITVGRSVLAPAAFGEAGGILSIKHNCWRG